MSLLHLLLFNYGIVRNELAIPDGVYEDERKDIIFI